MNPRFIDDMSWRMGEVYAAVTDEILVNMARHFKYMTEGNAPSGAWEYQAIKLAEMGQVNQETEAIILKHLGDADGALRYVLEESIRDGLKNAEPALRKAAEKGFTRKSSVPELAPNQMQAFRAFYNQSSDKLNLVNTVMLDSTQQAYQATVSDIVGRMQRTQGILNTETGEVVTGVTSMNKAVRQGVRKMVDNGITGYIDHGGHHWSPEAYVTMDIRTTMANTAREAVFERQDDYGSNLFQVSHHDGARPLCYPWQGQVISRDGWVGVVQDSEGDEVQVFALEETSYGEPAGLFGINCGHYPIPFFPGYSRIREPEQDEEANAKEYKESQQQRALERDLRNEKRELAVMKAQGAPEEEIRAQKQRVAEARDNLDAFCDKTGRARRSGREGTPINATFPDGYKQTYYERGIKRGSPFEQQAQTDKPEQKPFEMNYGRAFDYTGTRPKVQKQFADAKATLDNAPENVKKAWSKTADGLIPPKNDAGQGAYYDPYFRDTHFASYNKAFDESDYQRKNACFFHEYGHNIDHALVPGLSNYYSTTYVDGNGRKFIDVLENEMQNTLNNYYLKINGFDMYDAIKAAQNSEGGMGFGSFTRQMLKAVMPSDEYKAIRETLFDAGDDDSVLRPLAEKWLKPHFERELRAIVKKDNRVASSFCTWVKSTYSIYERTDISDMFGNYMTRIYGDQYCRPFTIGHKASYQRDPENLPIETFAEMFSATVTQSDSLKCIKEFFPESYAFFEEMLGAL